jgi:UDP-2,4-diacetamido-2,4,6-trideoxy-beta-L-altropyranose hydrolase
VLRPNADHILAIDDLANRRHDADLLLDQNYAEDAEGRYAALLPPFAVRLLGPRYALLCPEYALERRSRRPRDGHVRRVLVFFGGSDQDDLTGLALAVLEDPALAHLHLDLVIGANNPNRDRLMDRAAARPGTSLHGPRPHLADLMSAADLAIGAGGATTWERCCLGLPGLVVSIAENQRPACMALAAAGVIHYLGHADQVDAVVLRTAIGQLMADPVRSDAMSRAGLDLVDGCGTKRVARAMHEETIGTR